MREGTGRRGKVKYRREDGEVNTDHLVRREGEARRDLINFVFKERLERDPGRYSIGRECNLKLAKHGKP